VPAAADAGGASSNGSVTAEPRTDRAAAEDASPSETGGAAHGDEVLPDLTWVAPWQTPWRDEPVEQSQAVSAAAGEAPSVGEVLADLRAIAQRRLQLSATRVEAVLDEASREQRSLPAVLDEIRAMSIRGVMPATVDAMVDEMSAVAAEHRSV
jgi:hypothetical protein